MAALTPWKVTLQQPLNQLGNLSAIFSQWTQHIKELASEELKRPHLVVYPELYLTGYPLKDVCLQEEFRLAYQQQVETLNAWLRTMPPCPKLGVIAGGLHYDPACQPYPANVAYFATPGEELKIVHQKILLPNYDIFDEKKYFVAGKQVQPFRWQDKTLCVLVCEDLWATKNDDPTPLRQLQQIQAEQPTDLLIALSASPFDVSKMEQRKLRCQEISQSLGCSVIYSNKVSADDELIFDGGSFFLSANQKTWHLSKEFAEDQITFEYLPQHQVPTADSLLYQRREVSLRVTCESSLGLRPLSDMELESITQALVLGIQQYSQRCGFKHWLVALSGGIDSSLVLALAKLASLNNSEKLSAIYMPGFYSASQSYQLSQEICDRMKIPLGVLPIKFLHSTARNTIKDHLGFELSGLGDENIQSRLRGTLLYAAANQLGAMVLNTSNKSEIAVGYSTLYGDSVGALSVIGDLYKTYVYQLSDYLNRAYSERGIFIPPAIIEREPSAELRSDQKDSDSLPPYPVLDYLLASLFDERLAKAERVDQETWQKVKKLWERSEFKRAQFPPILKVFPKSFGFGHRSPIARSTEYL